MEEYENILQEWIDDGLVETDGNAVYMTEAGRADPLVSHIFLSLSADIVESLYSAGLIDLIYDAEQGKGRYVTTESGLNWANMLFDMYED